MNKETIVAYLEKWFLRRKESIVGIDLGSSSVKIAQLARRGEGWALVRLALKEVPTSTNEGLNEESRLAALKELLQGIDRRRSHFVVCFNGPESGVRVLTVPPMPRRELVSAVRLEAQNYFPFSTSESLLEVESSGGVLERGLKKERVVAAVTPRKTAGEIVALCRKLDIRPTALMPVACALKELVRAQGLREEESRCLLDLGDRHTVLMIVRGKYLIFCREIPVTGRDFSEAMTGALYSERGKTELSLEEAEVLKREVGLSVGEEQKLISDKISSTQLYFMLRSPLELLISEVDHCLEFYQEASGFERPASLVLFGRGASLKGLPQALSGELGLEVKVGDPLERIGHEAQVVRPEGVAGFAAALGAALSRGKDEINLLPPEIKQEIEHALRRVALQSAAAAALLILSFVYIGMRIQLANYQKRITVAELELSSLEIDLARAREKIIAHNIRSEEPYWEDVLREIANLVPSAAHLSELGYRQGRLYLKGVIASREKETLLADFILNLEKGIFRGVRLVTTKETVDPSKSEFEVECGFD